MKRTLTSLAVLLIATAATASPAAKMADAVISSTSSGEKTPYAYINPYGVGPNNDSR